MEYPDAYALGINRVLLEANQLIERGTAYDKQGRGLAAAQAYQGAHRLIQRAQTIAEMPQDAAHRAKLKRAIAPAVTAWKRSAKELTQPVPWSNPVAELIPGVQERGLPGLSGMGRSGMSGLVGSVIPDWVILAVAAYVAYRLFLK